MSFSGFPEEGGGAGQGARPKKVASNSSGKSKEQRLLAATERKLHSVLACSAPLPDQARLSAAATPSTPVKLRISDDGRCNVVGGDDATSAPLGKTTKEEPVKHGGTETDSEKNEENETSAKEESPKPQDASSSKLEMFQEKQKLIEEQNRKRKELLSKAIHARQQQTDQESRKLTIVQAELAKIDTLLNTDVQFLRESIEQASFDFMKAQKRYDDAEKEFISAKLHLFGVSEKKELLTDHLCSIIEQNEARKGRRLTELMEELELDAPEIGQGEAVSLKELRPAADFNTLKKSEPGEAS